MSLLTPAGRTGDAGRPARRDQGGQAGVLVTARGAGVLESAGFLRCQADRAAQTGTVSRMLLPK